MFLIAFAIYRLRTWTGVAAGVGVALVLYGLNFAIFRGLGLEQQSPEGRTFRAFGFRVNRIGPLQGFRCSETAEGQCVTIPLTSQAPLRAGHPEFPRSQTQVRFRTRLVSYE